MPGAASAGDLLSSVKADLAALRAAYRATLPGRRTHPFKTYKAAWRNLDFGRIHEARPRLMDAQFFTQSLLHAALQDLLVALQEQEALARSKRSTQESSLTSSVATQPTLKNRLSISEPQWDIVLATEATNTANARTPPPIETTVGTTIGARANENNATAPASAAPTAENRDDSRSRADDLSFAVFSLYTLYHTQPGAKMTSAAKSEESQLPRMCPIRVSAETCLKLADVRASLLWRASEGERHATEALTLLTALVHPVKGTSAIGTSSSGTASSSIPSSIASSSASSSISKGSSSGGRSQSSVRDEVDYATSAFNVCAFDAPVPKHPGISSCFRPASHLWDAPLRRLISTRKLPAASPIASVLSSGIRAVNNDSRAVLGQENASKLCQLSRAYSSALQECRKAATSAQEQMRRNVRQAGALSAVRGKDSSSSRGSFSIWDDNTIKRIAAAGTLAQDLDARANKSLQFASTFQPTAHSISRPSMPSSIQPPPPPAAPRPRQRQQQQLPPSQRPRRQQQQPPPPKRSRLRRISDSELAEDASARVPIQRIAHASSSVPGGHLSPRLSDDENVWNDDDDDGVISSPTTKQVAPSLQAALPHSRPTGKAVKGRSAPERTNQGSDEVRNDALVRKSSTKSKLKVKQKRTASEVTAVPPADTTNGASAAVATGTLDSNLDGHRVSTDPGTSAPSHPSKRARLLLTEESAHLLEAPDTEIEQEVAVNIPKDPALQGASRTQEGESVAPVAPSSAHAGDVEDILAALERELE